MTRSEKVAFLNAGGREALARHGIASRIVNLSGQGKLKPGPAVMRGAELVTAGK
jgi:hypothetical protein